jgi:hypothetical protein
MDKIIEIIRANMPVYTESPQPDGIKYTSLKAPGCPSAFGQPRCYAACWSGRETQDVTIFGWHRGCSDALKVILIRPLSFLQRAEIIPHMPERPGCLICALGPESILDGCCAQCRAHYRAQKENMVITHWLLWQTGVSLPELQRAIMAVLVRL